MSACPLRAPCLLRLATLAMVVAVLLSGCPRSTAPESREATSPGLLEQAADVERSGESVAAASGAVGDGASSAEEAAEDAVVEEGGPDLETLPPGWNEVPAPALTSSVERVDTGITHVIIISVDGVRSDAIVALGEEGAPTWHRLMREGSFTLNARTDPRRTYTNPNHLGMITGLPTDGDSGHGLRSNREVETTLHEVRGSYLPSVFDVTFHHGLRGAVYASKDKLDLLSRSWRPEHAAPSLAREDNDAERIVAEGFTDLDDETTHGRAMALLGQPEPPEFFFLQYSRSDGIGHSNGFDPTPDSPYMRELTRIDGYLSEVMSAVESHDAMRGRTAIILTTDHGGEGRNHFNLDHSANWIIPFVVWGPGVAPGADLYVLNEQDRAEPGDVLADEADPPPVRNIEAGNLALRLLGLPPVPASVVGVSPPLRLAVSEEPSGR